VYPASFEYHRATSVQDALALLDRFADEGKLLAGGHSLIPLMKLRFAAPAHVIDIGRLTELSGISESGGVVTLGAMTRHRDVAESAVIRARLAALSDAAGQIGDVQVRNRGTIGGSLAHADPGADLPAVVMALGAEIVALGRGGERRIPADRFCTDTFTTALERGELVTQVRIPVPKPGTGTAYVKHPDPASGYAVAGVAALVSVDAGKVAAARVALTGLLPKATRLTSVESALAGRPVGDAPAAAERAADGLEVFDDARGTAAYKANLARVFTARALERAIARAR
jgi:carbon-monoxide dehydrogenase medium subunit